MKFGIVGNTEKQNFENVVFSLLDKLDSDKIEYSLPVEIGHFIQARGRKLPDSCITGIENLFESVSVLVTLGGDGTILKFAPPAAKRGIPILGVNLGKLGFLAEVSEEELHAIVDEIRTGGYLISERIMVEGEVEKNKMLGLNDIVVDRGGTFRVIDVEIYINEEHLITYKGDGLIVSTPTGSTGYSMSCGGPIAAPEMEIFLLTPISPHTLNARPMIIPSDKEIKVIVRSPAGKLSISEDGQRQAIVPSPVEITCRRSRYRIKLIKRKARATYDVLRTKLMWGRDVRLSY